MSGWVQLPQEGDYEVQQNIFDGAFRHRLYSPNSLFHDWHDGKPPFKYLKEHNRDEDG